MRSAFFSSLTLLCGASLASAQSWGVPSPGYAPAYRTPYAAPVYSPYAAYGGYAGRTPAYPTAYRPAAPVSYAGTYRYGYPTPYGHYPRPNYYYPAPGAPYAYGTPAPVYRAAPAPVPETSAAVTTPPVTITTEDPPPATTDKATTMHILPPAAELYAPFFPHDDEEEEPVRFARPHCERLWVSGAFLASIVRPGNLAAPLVTIGSLADTAPGALGQPGTGVLLDDSLDLNLFPGVRLETGLFLDDDRHYSIDIGGFYLFPQTERAAFAADQAGNPFLGRPIFNADQNVLGAIATSTPGAFTGATRVESRTELYGFEFNGRCHGYWHKRLHAEGLAGVRYARLGETLTIRDNLTPILNGAVNFRGIPLSAGQQLADADIFDTTNEFLGLQVGGRLRLEGDWFTLGFFGKIAAGANDQRVLINGTTAMVSPLGTVTTPGGVLALPSNSGEHNRTVFAILPEFGMNLEVALGKHVHLLGGYSMMLWTNTVRPGSQIDLAVSPGLVPSTREFGNALNPSRPFFTFNEEVFWVHTFSFGVELRF